MKYKDTLDYLFSQLPMYQRAGEAAYKKDIGNIIEACRILDNPHKKFKSIHIAGTNGKGSTAHIISSILQEAGYKVGLYTSPHLKDFRERIRINGKMISEKDIINFKMPKGCKKCNNTGFKGRRSIFQILNINSDVRNLIISGGTEKEIESKAKEAGMLNLSEVGVNLLKNGTISFGELERVISE